MIASRRRERRRRVMGVHVPLDLDLDTVYVVEVLLLHTSLPGEMPIPHSNNCLLNFCRKAYESKSPRSKTLGYRTKSAPHKQKKLVQPTLWPLKEKTHSHSRASTLLTRSRESSQPRMRLLRLPPLRHFSSCFHVLC